MNREQARAHIWGLSHQVASEFCVEREEYAELEAETQAALDALDKPS